MSDAREANSLADLRRVVALGERLSAATDERALGMICAGATAGLLGGAAAAFTTDRVGVAEGAHLDATALTTLRHAALDRVGPEGKVAALGEQELPPAIAAMLRATRCTAALVAPLRVQQEVVGTLSCCVHADVPEKRLLLAAVAQLASAFLAALRVTDAVRAETRQIEALLERRTRELRTAETHLIVTDRLAAIGTLAAGIGHEIANPLASVMLNNGALTSRLGRSGLPAGALADAQRLLGENDEALDRIRTIVGELRTFVRRDDGTFTALDVRSVVESSVRLARAQLRGIEVKMSLATLPTVSGSGSRLGQVFLNLVVNAAQALASVPRGKIDIEAAPVGAEVVVSVTDNGPGVPAEHLPRIFDIYFTTKAQGEGTGLGLAIAHDIVAMHGGRIEVESPPGKGATFKVYLPARQPPAELGPPERVDTPATPAVRPARRRPTSRPALEVPRLKPRVLIIDDEPAILRALQRELEEEFDVRVVSSGDQALDLYAIEAFDCFLCDLNLLGESGLDVVARLVEKDARLEARCVYMSGGTLSERARAVAAADPARFVAKPFDLPALIKLLKLIVSTPSP